MDPAAYLTNFNIALQGAWPGVADHFWSLAVEEQFYILWFIADVILPARWFLPSLSAAIGTSLVFRLGVYFASLSPLTTVLLPGHMVTLAAGALVAYIEVMGYEPGPRSLSAAAPYCWVQSRLLRWSLCPFHTCSSRASSYIRLSPPFVSGAWCANAQTRHDGGHFWLDWAPLRHIGKISYGIFVYHMFIPHRPITAIVGASPWALFGGLVITSILIADISWFAVEQPVPEIQGRSHWIAFEGANNENAGRGYCARPVIRTPVKRSVGELAARGYASEVLQK